MLFLKTFGGLSVEAGGALGTGAGQRRKTLALLALLATAGNHGMGRDKLIAFLWPDTDLERGRNLLKQACFTLRHDLHAPEVFLGVHELRLNPDAIDSDIQRFEGALQGGSPERAVAFYVGPFLDGFYLTGTEEFERWVEEQRARLATRTSDALESLAVGAATRGDVGAAVRWWRRHTQLDPLSAHGALGLMRALDDAGERAEAVAHGLGYQRLVLQELGAEPATDVVVLTQQLRHATGEPRKGKR